MLFLNILLDTLSKFCGCEWSHFIIRNKNSLIYFKLSNFLKYILAESSETPVQFKECFEYAFYNQGEWTVIS